MAYSGADRPKTVPFFQVTKIRHLVLPNAYAARQVSKNVTGNKITPCSRPPKKSQQKIVIFVAVLPALIKLVDLIENIELPEHHVESRGENTQAGLCGATGLFISYGRFKYGGSPTLILRIVV
ncbi:MAG: hypothetical protein R6W75_13570 [Smithellaceae bacterium]